MDYYELKMLSFSSVRIFAQNPMRALADYQEKFDWFQSKKALHIGQIVHAGLEDFLNGTNTVLPEFLEKTEGLTSKKAPHGLLADYKGALTYLDVMKNTDILQELKSIADSQDENLQLFTEAPFFGEIDGIKYKGKLDVFYVDHAKKEIHAFDFKTSAKYDSSGIDWGKTIDGVRECSSVIWHEEKMFPWQAGAYSELLRQNGYSDYTITYQYIVVTKEKTPRIDIWSIDDETMKIGLTQFNEALVRANAYVTGQLEPILVADDSDFYNQTTQKSGNQLSSSLEVKEVDGIDVSDL